MNNKGFFKTFRIIAILEGISFLLILFVSMPLKYLFDMPQLTFPLGMVHGFLFIAYVILTFLGKMIERWSIKVTAIIFVASFIPFGTFYIEKKYLQD